MRRVSHRGTHVALWASAIILMLAIYSIAVAIEKGASPALLSASAGGGLVVGLFAVTRIIASGGLEKQAMYRALHGSLPPGETRRYQTVWSLVYIVVSSVFLATAALAARHVQYSLLALVSLATFGVVISFGMTVAMRRAERKAQLLVDRGEAKMTYDAGQATLSSSWRQAPASQKALAVVAVVTLLLVVAAVMAAAISR